MGMLQFGKKNKHRTAFYSMNINLVKEAKQTKKIILYRLKIIHHPAFHWAKYFIKSYYNYLLSTLAFRAVTCFFFFFNRCGILFTAVIKILMIIEALNLWFDKFSPYLGKSMNRKIAFIISLHIESLNFQGVGKEKNTTQASLSCMFEKL